jgi:hypothetical protein
MDGSLAVVPVVAAALGLAVLGGLVVLVVWLVRQ